MSRKPSPKIQFYAGEDLTDELVLRAEQLSVPISSAARQCLVRYFKILHHPETLDAWRTIEQAEIAGAL